MTTIDKAPHARTRLAPWLRPWLFACLVAALLLAPWLGGIHAVLHQKAGGQLVTGPAATLSATTPYAAADHTHVTGLFRLFGGHTHDNDCRLFDQLSHADGLHLTSVMPPVLLPPVAVLAWHAGECLRRWATLFDARGPPFLA